MPDLATLGDQFGATATQAIEIWHEGGWAMYFIATIALVMCTLGMHVLTGLRAKRFSSVPEKTWRKWIDQPELRRGPIGRRIEFITGHASLKEMSQAMAEMHRAESMPFERDLKVMKICVNAAPLVGLLGTVTGMLTTFGGLASGSGGEGTLGQIAGGISEALITTETGLVVALPGLFFHHYLKGRFEAYKGFLSTLESACARSFHDAEMALEQENREKLLERLRSLQAQGA